MLFRVLATLAFTVSLDIPRCRTANGFGYFATFLAEF